MLPGPDFVMSPSSSPSTGLLWTQSSPGFASISCRQSWSWATLGFLDLLVNCGYQPDPCFSRRWIWHPSSVQCVPFKEACTTSPFGELEYAGLVGVALRAMRWASLSGVCERHSCLTTGGGAEDDMLIVTCIHSGLSWVALVEWLDCVFCIVEVFRGVPDFIVFW